MIFIILYKVNFRLNWLSIVSLLILGSSKELSSFSSTFAMMRKNHKIKFSFPFLDFLYTNNYVEKIVTSS